MNELTHNLVKEYKPQLAIVVYASADGETNRWDDTYLESHDINADGSIGAGKPLKQSTIEGIVEVFYTDQQDRVRFSGLMPENMLSFNILPGGGYSMLWYTKAHLQQLYFSNALIIPSGTAWVPPMIWKVNRNELCVYALTSEDRPSLDTPLMVAPFHNVNSGVVCLGSAKVKKAVEKTFASEIAYWESMFWLSEFSHLAGDNKAKSNINMIWKKLVQDKTIGFPLDELLPAQKTVKSLFK